MMTKIWTFIRHNSGICIGTPLCCLVLFYVYSCQSMVVSLVDPNHKITRAELVNEVEALLASAETKFDDLDRQDLVKGTIFNSVLELAQGGTINPAGIALVIGNVLGAGADNIRKRTHINTLKGGNVNAKSKKSVKKILQPNNN